MFGRIKTLFTGHEPKAFIDRDGNLFAPSGEFVGSYSRTRDAIRGAKRRGFNFEVA